MSHFHTISRWESLQDTGAIQVHPMQDIDAKDYEAGFLVDVENPLCFPRIVCKWMIFHWIVLFSHFFNFLPATHTHTHIYIYYICVCIYLFYYYLLIERFIYIAAPTCSKNVSIHLLISPKWLVGCPCHSFVPEDVHIAGPNPRPAAVSCRSSGKSIEKISLRTYFSGEFSWFILIYTQSTPY